MIIQLQFSEIMGCANLFQRFLTLAVYCISTLSILLTRVRTRDLACAQMKFHKHMHDSDFLKLFEQSDRAGRKSQGRQYCQVCWSGCPTTFFDCVFCFAPVIGNATGMILLQMTFTS
jgi:hypothetical protein